MRPPPALALPPLEPLIPPRTLPPVLPITVPPELPAPITVPVPAELTPPIPITIPTELPVTLTPPVPVPAAVVPVPLTAPVPVTVTVASALVPPGPPAPVTGPPVLPAAAVPIPLIPTRPLPITVAVLTTEPPTGIAPAVTPGPLLPAPLATTRTGRAGTTLRTIVGRIRGHRRYSCLRRLPTIVAQPYSRRSPQPGPSENPALTHRTKTKKPLAFSACTLKAKGLKYCSAASYSPTHSRMQYHRRSEA